MKHIPYIFFFCLLASVHADAQLKATSNLKRKKIVASGTVQLDSLSIVPQSVVIAGIDTSYYSIDIVSASMNWKKQTGNDSVWITYRVFPFRFNAEASRYNYDSIRKATVFTPYVVEKAGRETVPGVFDFGKINYSGSFGRSLSFGNNQDAVFNSQMNLQMSGYIGDSIEIAAAITDNNLPIQPDGTTRQLNEFDKILLRFSKKGHELSLGDIDIRQDNSYFLRFYKRLQGVSYRQQNSLKNDRSNNLLVSGAIAKGKFTRNIFPGQEGNQGPYRLSGANNEFFFIVLAGTERVYIDGELMQRGDDLDYVINYNTAEVTFTPRRMITKDRRIQVEFEYADRNYLNSMLYAGDEFIVNKRLKVFVSAYNNTDAKNSPINQTLDAKQRQFLANLGDSVHLALYPVASIDSFSISKILYQKKDTTYGSTTESIYVYSTDRDSARYNLNFIEVGYGRGNYVALFNAANGKVYRWVQPIGGVRQGNFEPATFLVTPKKQQVVSGGFIYDGDKTAVTAEFALSDYDLNTLSAKDKSGDKGFAGKFSVKRTGKWRNGSREMQLNTMIGYEFVQQQFRPVERLRSVEFGRDWGLPYITTAADEHLPYISMQLSDDKNNSVQYSFSSYLRSDHYKGYRHELIQLSDIYGWKLRSSVNLTNSHTPAMDGFFFRPSAELSKKLVRSGNYIIGGSYSLERNEQKDAFADTLIPSSFSFDVISAFVRSNPDRDNRWAFTYFTRRDKLPFGKTLAQADQSQNYNLTLELLQNRKHQLRSTVTYRRLTVQDKNLAQSNADNSLLGRGEYMINEWKGLITGNVVYELGAGQEQKRDYSYFEVPAGRGEYAWIDYNGDGIPQLNEFETALYPDQAKYIRIFTPTNQFIKANYTQLNYSFMIDPRSIMGMKNTGWKKFIGRFNIQSSMQAGKKVLSDGHPEFNPFKGNISDQSLITLNYVLSNTLSFNRYSSTWGVDISNINSYNKALLTYGVESRQLNDWVFKGRVNAGPQYQFELINRIGNNDLVTPVFANRNYSLKSYTAEPRVIYTHSARYRLQASYQYTGKQNAMANGGERSINHAFAVESKYNAARNAVFSGKIAYNNISYTGAKNTTTSYIMLDGLLPGKNVLWSLELTKRLINNLEINVQYEGRKPGDSRAIHIGRASIRALL